MTEITSISDPTDLNGPRILSLFRLLDEVLEEPTSILVVGGAALAVHWHEQNIRQRSTRDIDFAPIAYHDFPEHSTYTVDIATPSMPAHIMNASEIIAERETVEPDWLNNKVINVMAPDVEYEPTEMFCGHRLDVYRPSLKVLLAMKLKARREAKDLSDAIQLALETGIDSTEKMLLLVEDTFGEEHVAFDVQDFISDVEYRYRLLHGRESGAFSERDFGLQ